MLNAAVPVHGLRPFLFALPAVHRGAARSTQRSPTLAQRGPAWSRSDPREVHMSRRTVVLGATAALALVTAGSALPALAGRDGGTTTPIRHLVVIFQENVSFDHYFATYPEATNPRG